jgi:hypothetical protein
MAVAMALLVAGCGGDDDGTSASTTTVTAPLTLCKPATTDLMTPLANRLTLEGAGLSNGQIVESAEHENVYFVAAEIDSPQLPNSGDIAVWATTSRHGGEAIYSVNELAEHYSDWRLVDAGAIEASADDPAAREARACVFR